MIKILKILSFIVFKWKINSTLFKCPACQAYRCLVQLQICLNIHLHHYILKPSNIYRALCPGLFIFSSITGYQTFAGTLEEHYDLKYKFSFPLMNSSCVRLRLVLDFTIDIKGDASSLLGTATQRF